jgi:hypothetical protein
MRPMCRAALSAIVLSGLICACTGAKPSQSDQSVQAVQAMRDEVSRVVPDAARKEKLHATIDRYENELRTFNRTASGFRDSLRAVNANPDASREQFAEVIAHYEADRRATRARLVQIHHELLALTTDDEWRSIAKREVKILRLSDPARAREEAE